MPDQISSYEQALRADMETLAVQIRDRREKPEFSNAGEQEILKDAIRAFPRLEKVPPVNASAAPVPQAQPVQGAQSASPLPAYAESAPAEVKLEIEYLIDLTLRDGIAKALDEAEKSPYFVQDAFHDALAGKLYPELQKRGVMK